MGGGAQDAAVEIRWFWDGRGMGTAPEDGGPGGGGGDGPQLRRRARPRGQGADIHSPLGGARTGGGHVVPHPMRVITRDRLSGAAGGGPMTISSSPRLCVSVGIPGGGFGGWDFQRVWEGPGVGGRWSGAFHARSDSTAWVGGRVRSRDRGCTSGARPGGRACEVRGSRLIEPREPAGPRAEPRGRIFVTPTPLRPLRISSLAN